MDFDLELPDRFLGDPIDMITFKGLSAGKLELMSFIEIISCDLKLNQCKRT